MPERFPLLIGITGKRQFSKNIEEDRQYEADVRSRLTTIFETLDDDYPGVPKILLTGAAYGADLIAAHAALARNGDTGKRWAVVALLPFEQTAFRKDFATENNKPEEGRWPERYQQHLNSFDALLNQAKGASPRVTVHALPKLDPHLPAGGTRPAATPEDLAVGIPREWYYEQVGQFIAESANILIAVMPKEAEASLTKATGGSARIVAHRRIGRADAIGNEVAQHSAILRREWPDLAAPPGGFVWLLVPELRPAALSNDAERLQEKKRRIRPLFGLKYCWEVGPYPVEVLPPLLDCLDAEPYPAKPAQYAAASHRDEPGPLRRAWRVIREALASAGILRPLALAIHQHQLKASLTSANALKIFNEHKPTTPEIIAKLTPIGNLTEECRNVAETISDTQMLQNWKSRRSFGWLASLFVVALVVFEIYAKFFPTHWHLLAFYLLVLAVIVVVVFRARWNLWQAKAEDYRAVAEILRVQNAWWSAGLPLRVDREHLQGADRELARIRDAATSLIAWLLIRHGLKQPETNWGDVCALESTERIREEPVERPENWVGGQVAYFSEKAKQRLESVHKSDATSWTLFLASGFMATILLVWLVATKDHHYPVFEYFQRIAAVVAIRGTSGCLFATAFWAMAAGVVVWFRMENSDLRGVPVIIATALFGLVVAILCSLSAVSAAPLLPADFQDSSHLNPEKSMMIVVLVGLSAVAGARRYLTERLNTEAEAHDYRDAEQRFVRAKHLLGKYRPGGTEPNENAAKKIVAELGRLALEENEAWLKSRRERPLTPVVG